MLMLKSKKQTFMIYMVGWCASVFKIRIAVLVLILSFSLSLETFSQMTTRDMDNFKKLDKAKQKKQKQKGPSINTKKRSSSPKKTRQKKSGFTKKRYKLSYILREEYLMNISA